MLASSTDYNKATDEVQLEMFVGMAFQPKFSANLRIIR